MSSLSKSHDTLVILAAGMTALLPMNPVSAQSFTAEDLGSINGSTGSAYGLNDAGTVVGVSSAADHSSEYHGFVWDGSMTDLHGLPGDPHSIAFAINDSGQIVGVSYALGDVKPHAFRWESGSLTDLGNFSPKHINNAGQVVGSRVVATGDVGAPWTDRACLWTGGSLSSLGTLGGASSYAMDINEAGWVVGGAQTADGTMRAFLWKSGKMTDLGTLGGKSSQAYAINNKRQVVGVADTASGKPHAFLFALSTSGAVVDRLDLGDLGGGSSLAYDINDLGQAVGTSNAKAFLWNGGPMVKLTIDAPSGTGWKINAATAINNNATIVANGRHDGMPRGVVLTSTGGPCAAIAPPGNVKATDGQYAAHAKITWNGVSGASGYDLWRRPAAGGDPYVLIASAISGTSYLDKSGAACVVYKYKVRARRDCGRFSKLSAADTGYRGICDVPSGAVASGGGEPDVIDMPADLDGNAAVDNADLKLLLAAWGPCADCPADLNGDGVVNADDLLDMLGQLTPG